MQAIESVIARFGGLSDLARALGHKNPTTVQGWKVRGNVPSRQIPAIVQAAKDRGIPLEPADFFDTPDSLQPDKHHEAAA